MNSSPRPVRRFSRWKTTKRTFVLGGNTYVTGNKDHKASGVKHDNSSTIDDKRTKIRHSPRSPHKEKSHPSPDLETKESSSFDNVDFNCKVLIHNLHDPDKADVVLSNNELAHNDCIVSKSPQALTVLSPNVTATTKDSQTVISPSKGHNVEADNDDKSHPSSVTQTDQLDSGTTQDSNPDSVHIDKENSTTVIATQPERSSCSASPNQTAIVPPDSVKSKNADEPASGSSMRRQSLRDRSLLQSSAVLRQRNYPFFTVSKKKRSTEKKRKKSVNKLLPSPLSTVIHEKRKDKEFVEKVTMVSGGNHHKSSKKSEKEKTNGTVDDESHFISQEEQSRSLSSSKTHSFSERKNGSGDCVAQLMSISQTISRSNKRKNKDSGVETVVNTKKLKSGAKKRKQKGDEVESHIALPNSLIQSTTSVPAHSRQETSMPPSSPKSIKRKDRWSERQQLEIAKCALNASTKTQTGTTSSKSNGHGSIAKGRNNIKTSHEISMHSSGARPNSTVILNASSRRTLRDRSVLGTPQMQYPAKYMSAALIKSLSEKAKRLLSIPGTKADSKTSPEKERIASKRYAEESVASNVNIPRKKTTNHLKACAQSSVEHSPPGSVTLCDNLTKKKTTSRLKACAQSSVEHSSQGSVTSHDNVSKEKTTSKLKACAQNSLEHSSQGNVTLHDNVFRKKTTSKSKASAQSSLKHSSQGNLPRKLSQASAESLSSKEKIQPNINHVKKIGSKNSKHPPSSPKQNRKANTQEASGNLSQDVLPDNLSQVPSASVSSEYEVPTKKSRGSKSSKLTSSSPNIKRGDNYERNGAGERDFEKDKEALNRANSHVEEMKKKSNNFCRSRATTKNRKPTLIISSCEHHRNWSSGHVSADRLDGPLDDTERNTKVSGPTTNQNEDMVLNETAVGSKKGFKRRLFQDSFSQPKKMRLRRDLYETAGRDILLWSENGEARKGSSVTSIDVIFNDVIELEDDLKDSETEYLQQRVVGKVMGRMKRSLKSQISELENVRELESQVKMSRDRCNKIRANIKEYEDKERGLNKKLKKRKETEQKTLQEWMKSFKSFMALSRKT